MNESDIVMYGKHAVYEALAQRPDLITQLHIRDDVELDPTVPLPVKPRRFSGKKLPCQVPSTATHQGMIAVLKKDGLLTSYDEWLSAQTLSPATAVMILGEMQDPHNVGAVIRSAAAFGMAAVLIPKHRQASITGTVIKVSAGMAFTVPLVEIGNVNRTLTDLKSRGFFVYGLASGEGATTLSATSFTTPTAFVLGSEADGLRLKTKEHCDQLLRIPMHPRCESLNAATAAACVMHTWSTQQPQALRL